MPRNIPRDPPSSPINCRKIKWCFDIEKCPIAVFPLPGQLHKGKHLSPPSCSCQSMTFKWGKRIGFYSVVLHAVKSINWMFISVRNLPCHSSPSEVIQRTVCNCCTCYTAMRIIWANKTVMSHKSYLEVNSYSSYSHGGGHPVICLWKRKGQQLSPFIFFNSLAEM